MKVSENIKKYRKKAGLTQEQLAEKVGVTQVCVAQWESGWSQPRMGKVCELASLFNVTITNILEGEPADEPFINVDLISLNGNFCKEQATVIRQVPVLQKIYQRYPNSFLVEVNTESFNLRVPKGCFALICPDETYEDGRVYACQLNNNAPVVCRIETLSHGYKLIPESTDPTIKTQIVDFENNDQLICLGRVVFYFLPATWEL